MIKITCFFTRTWNLNGSKLQLLRIKFVHSLLFRKSKARCDISNLSFLLHVMPHFHEADQWYEYRSYLEREYLIRFEINNKIKNINILQWFIMISDIPKKIGSQVQKEVIKIILNELFFCFWYVWKQMEYSVK